MANVTAVRPPALTGVPSRSLGGPRYVVELCRSALPIDPLDVPQLELLALYHLYGDVRAQGGVRHHSLRLGFFKELDTANAMARCLAGYFSATRVVQIDAAEVIRSLRQRVLPLKDIGASGTHEVIEVTAPPPLPAAKPAMPAGSSAPRRNPPRSVWSRLLGHLLDRAPRCREPGR